MGREGAYARVYGDGVAWVGVGRGGGGGVKNKFGLKCFLDDVKCYKAFVSSLFFCEKSTHR